MNLLCLCGGLTHPQLHYAIRSESRTKSSPSINSEENKFDCCLLLKQIGRRTSNSNYRVSERVRSLIFRPKTSRTDRWGLDSLFIKWNNRLEVRLSILSLSSALFPFSRPLPYFSISLPVFTMVGKGRKKVENKLIEDASSRMVCFSKRRKGLFKKAEELSILTGAKIGILAFSQAGKLYCSDAQTLDFLLCPQADISSEEKEIEDALESTFVEAMIEELYSSDLPTLNPQLVISSEKELEDDGWESAFTEAMDGNLNYSDDAATIDSLIYPQFDMISTAKEVGNCWESDFAETMAGKDFPFWYDRPQVQSMGSEELQRFERAIMEYRHMQLAKNMGCK